MEPYDIKLHSLLEKLHPKSELRALLAIDDKTGGRRMEMTVNTNINNTININKGVELKDKTG